jgi:signal transduction histidine kinase
VIDKMTAHRHRVQQLQIRIRWALHAPILFDPPPKREHPQPGLLSSLLEQIQRTGAAAVDDLRRLLDLLRDGDEAPSRQPPLDLAGIPALVAAAREGGLDVQLRVSGEVCAVPPGPSAVGYRIVQESLTNSRKHGGACRASVDIACCAERIEVRVVDDGTTLLAPASGGGHGLIGMRERVALYGGSLETGTSAAGGYEVIAVIPLDGSSGRR